VLRRRSIRTKLIVAMAFLSAIVLLLAVSGFCGLYGHQQTTSELLLRSKQMLAAQRMQQLAVDMSFSNKHGLDRLRDQPMIGSTLETMDGVIDFDQLAFDVALESFQRTLDRYPRESIPGGNQLLAAVTEEESLAGIRRAFSPLAPYQDRGLPLAETARRNLFELLRTLSTATNVHVSFIQADMRRLSEELSRHSSTWTTVASICTAIALSMVGMLLWSLNSLVLKPFRTLLDGSRLVAGGQFDHRIDLGTGDELSELAVAMNEMTDRFQGALNKVNSWCTDLDRQVRDRTREVIQNEQLASVGFLAAGVAHEINNPLAAIAWSAESLESRVGEIAQMPSDQRKIDAELSKCLTDNLRRIEEEAYRCKGITEKLLDFSRLREVRRAPTNLVELVSDVVGMVSKLGKYRCKTIQVNGKGEVLAHINPQEIRQVVLNLVTNALESLDTDGAVNIDIETDGTTAAIAIIDNGCGMSDEVLKHIFEPFFTRRRDGTGTGLGLSITYRIISQHGGSLTANSEGEGHGSRMEILLPVEPDGNDTPLNRNSLGLTHER
jgi:two-component system NtrC family sensor kinase